jgi:benzylsuccinate CoA-transferase BbsF subunit
MSSEFRVRGSKPRPGPTPAGTVASEARVPNLELPLAGLKVADFSWVGVGPVTAKSLADHGATVVHVESLTRPETLRGAGPFKDNQPGVNRSAFFANFNSSKIGISLNLAVPEARAAARRLIGWADVMLESFTPGVVRRWGLDYESLREDHPSLVVFSTNMQGQTGPHAHQPGFGTVLACLAGFNHLTGWPDREPAGLYGAYTDFIAPRFAISVLLAALEHRWETGEGQYIDLSQYETALQFLAPVLLDYAANGRVAARIGNDDTAAAPHGALPSAGEDRWLAIAVGSDAEWRALVQALGDPEWTQERRFATILGRRRHAAELAERLATWTRIRTPREAMHALQAAGVPAGAVQTCDELHDDPQLAHRGHFRRLRHPEIGEHAYDSPAFRLSRTPAVLSRPGPLLGQHNELVLKDLLGYSDDEIAELVIAGALE